MRGVDFGELAAPKMMIFERVVWSFPRALFAARFGFLRYFFHLVFWVVGPRAQTGQMRKLTHIPCENLFFKVRARAGAGAGAGQAAGGEDKYQKETQKAT